MFNYLKRVPIYDIFSKQISTVSSYPCSKTRTMTTFSNVANLQPEEVNITVPWGHIAAKWWGRKDLRPIICLHGWQDNAGTFDRLMPLLPKHLGYLAIDMPGHGLSSRLPPGLYYDAMLFVYLLKIIKNEYKWKKLSILAHSMGAIYGFMYTSFFPDEVDMMIAIDGVKPFLEPAKNYVPISRYVVEGYLTEAERTNSSSEPPSYFYDEVVEKLYEGRLGSVEKEYAHHLLERGVTKSDLYPNKYYFNRDGRIRYLYVMTYNNELCNEMAKRIKAPYLQILATQSAKLNREDTSISTSFVQFMNSTLPSYELHVIDAKHHLHLNEPEKISEIISQFINSIRPEGSEINEIPDRTDDDDESINPVSKL